MAKPSPSQVRINTSPPSSLAHRPAQDTLSIRSLQLPNGMPAPYIFGPSKTQPAYLNLRIPLRDTFGSAAAADKLDESTIHYGNLAKRVRAVCAEEAESGGKRPVETVLGHVIEMAERKETGTGTRAEGIEVEIVLPKAGAHGGSLGLREWRRFEESGLQSELKRAFVCRGMRVMALVGVNKDERTARQGLLVDFDLDVKVACENSGEDMMRLFPLERVLAEMIEKTDFETLESLAEFAVKELKGILAERGISAWAVHLKFQKPAAIPWADGPVIEVHRRLD